MSATWQFKNIRTGQVFNTPKFKILFPSHSGLICHGKSLWPSKNPKEPHLEASPVSLSCKMWSTKWTSSKTKRLTQEIITGIPMCECGLVLFMFFFCIRVLYGKIPRVSPHHVVLRHHSRWPWSPLSNWDIPGTYPHPECRNFPLLHRAFKCRSLVQHCAIFVLQLLILCVKPLPTQGHFFPRRKNGWDFFPRLFQSPWPVASMYTRYPPPLGTLFH